MGTEEQHVYSAHVGRLCTLCGAAPFIIALISLGIMAFLSSFNFSFPAEGEGSGGQFDDLDNINTERFHAMDMLRFRSGSETVVFDRQSVASSFTDVILLYHIPGEYTSVVPGKPLLTADHIAGIRAFEDKIMALSGYYVGGANGTGQHQVRCMLKAKAGITTLPRNITSCTENIYEIPEGFECVRPRSVVEDYATGQPFLPVGATRATASAGRTNFAFGLPLPCLANSNLDDEGEIDPAFQSSNFSDWFGDVLMPYIEGEGRDELLRVGVSVRPWGNAPISYWFEKIITGDLAFVGVAAVAVAIVLLIMSRSLLLTVAGIFHILVSYYSAWSIFLLFGFRVMPGLVQMVMFIILGIGADDVFVVLDAWKRSHHETGSNINDSLAIKMSVVLRRAATAMFVTTFTTFAAFVATAASPVPAISAFGIYAAACVVLDYIYVITWFPAILCIYHRFFEFRTIWCPFQFKPFRCAFGDLDIPPALSYHPLYEKAQQQKEQRLQDSLKVAPEAEDADAAPPRMSVGVRKSGSVFGVEPAPEKPSGDDLIPRDAPLPAGPTGFARAVPGWVRFLDSRLAALGWVGTAFAAAREEPYEAETLDPHSLSFAERFFYFCVFPVVRLFRVPILILYLILFVITAIYAVQLEPAGENQIGLPDDQPLSQASRLLTEALAAGGDTWSSSDVCLVYGLNRDDPIDRDGVDPNAAEYLGAPIFETNFVAGPQLFEKIAGTCVRMVETADSFLVAQGKDPGPRGSRPAVDIDVSSAVVRDVPCLALSFIQWARADRELNPDAKLDWAAFRAPTALPSQYHAMNASEFATAVEAFVQSPAGAPYIAAVGFVRPATTASGALPAPERIRWLRDCYPAMMDPTKAATDDTVDMWESFAANERTVSETNFVEISSMFMRVASKNTMRKSTIQSAAISLVLVFIVMSIFSGSIPIAFIVTICILQILVFVFAYMVWRGWPLDFVESIALTVLVGISVDFTVHYGVAYQEADHKHRQRRLRFAMASMGTSITSGALTTLSSAALLFAATFEFFTKFGEFMFITISLSWLVANTLFPALVYYFGPTGHCCDIHYGCAMLLRRSGCCAPGPGEGQRKKGVADEEPTGDVRVEDV